ncbi:MAG TPA: hypothetical protein VJU53_02530 [Burkholderiaceae bacterium]|nr:hypothetical protein [Burkholderiaceae bacterium]
MNQFNNSSDDPLLAMALRNRMLARCFALIVVFVAILAITVHTAWQQPSASSNGIIDAGSDHSVARMPADGTLDGQLQLNPSETMFYSSNVHG